MTTSYRVHKKFNTKFNKKSWPLSGRMSITNKWPQIMWIHSLEYLKNIKRDGKALSSSRAHYEVIVNLHNLFFVFTGHPSFVTANYTLAYQYQNETYWNKTHLGPLQRRQQEPLQTC